MRVVVLGAGSWGTTVAGLAARRGPTLLWARRAELAEEINTHHTNEAYLPGIRLPETLEATADLAEAVVAADVLVVGVPTKGYREILAHAAPHLRPWVPVISLAKGFETGTLLRMTQVAAELLPDHPVGMLTGPNLAREVAAGQAAAAVVAMEEVGVAGVVQRLFHSGLFRVYLNEDLVGCEVGGALKNVIAIAAGMAEGLGVGDNTRAMVITRGLAELSRLGQAMGGKAETFSGLAGMGDLVATCISPLSRNRHVGEQLGRGRSLEEIVGQMHMVAEGVKTASLVMELAERYDLEMPICQAINQVVRGEIGPEDAYRGLSARSAGYERDAD